MHRVASCVFHSSPTSVRAVRWATEIPGNSDYGSWLTELVAVFNSGQGKRLASMLGVEKGIHDPKMDKLIRHTYTPNFQARLCLQIGSADGSTMRQVLYSNAAGKSSFLGAQARLFDQAGPGAILSSEWGYELPPLPGQGGKTCCKAFCLGS